MKTPAHYSFLIKQTARALGFDYCGIARAEELPEDARRLEKWLRNGMQGEMKYMENYFDLRIDPRKLVPGAASVITLLLNYYPQEKQEPNTPRISKYAYGMDYHLVIREKMNELIRLLQKEIGVFEGRGFVDSAPVLERTWAVKSGLGWVGKNGNMITKKSGSFFFIATLICDLKLEYDAPFVSDFCGTCTRCIDACPTEAILPNKVVDGSKCISYFTIELKDALLPESMKDQFEGWMFGCDTCQDVCPWNRFQRATEEKQFTPLPEILNLSTTQWEEMSEETFKQVFKHSPLRRTKWKGIRRNLQFIKGR